MNKVWQVATSAREEFFHKYPGLSRPVLQLLYNRGLRGKDEIDFFLNGRYEDNFDPFLFSQMEEAVALTIKAVKEGRKICVYGDYDADGITSSALLHEVLSIMKIESFVHIPDRLEGYGLHREAIDKIIRQGASFIITVDNGTRNKAEVAHAKEKGVLVVITDHHEAPAEESDLPDCPIVNPHLAGEKYPFKSLAGVGVAFKFARALLERSTLSREQKDKIMERVLDLVAIGTVADCVALLGENRLLLKKGLEALNATRRVGLKELMKKAKIESREIRAWNIGFQLAPRLNASGRIGSAGNAFSLLTTKDRAEAEKEAACLDERNQRRQKETEEIAAEVESQIKKQIEEKIIIGLCPDSSKAWNEGVIGLVAGRITEKYYKPTLIITKTEKGWKGSGRSIQEFNLFKAIEEAGDLLGAHGGHPMACGFTVSGANLAAFTDKMRRISKRELADLELEPKLRIDCEIGLSEVNRSFFREIKKLAPFGQENPEPRFLSEKVQIQDIVKMGSAGQHIKFRLGGLWGIGFSRAEEWGDLRISEEVDIVYYLEENEFNGSSSLQLKLIDIKPHGVNKIARGHWLPEPIYID